MAVTTSTVDLVRRVNEASSESATHHDLFATIDSLMRQAIGYDVAAYSSMDPAVLLPTSCDVFFQGEPGLHDLEAEDRLFQIEFKETDPFTYASLALSDKRVARLRGEVDDPDTVERFRELIEPMGAFDEMRLILRDRTGAWGTITMFRTDERPFETTDAALAAGLSEPLAGGMRLSFLRSAAKTGGVELSPGLFSLNESGELARTTAQAEEWFDTLTPTQLRGALSSLSARAGVDGSASATLSGEQGPVTIHLFPEKGEGDGLSGLIEHPRPILLARAIMRARGLTPRESDVTRGVARGLTTRAIAGELEISEYTVQDHLKSVFSKFGVVTRAELCAVLYGNHYRPKIEGDFTPGPYGWFLE